MALASTDIEREELFSTLSQNYPHVAEYGDNASYCRQLVQEAAMDLSTSGMYSHLDTLSPLPHAKSHSKSPAHPIKGIRSKFNTFKHQFWSYKKNQRVSDKNSPNTSIAPSIPDRILSDSGIDQNGDQCSIRARHRPDRPPPPLNLHQTQDQLHPLTVDTIGHSPTTDHLSHSIRDFVSTELDLHPISNQVPGSSSSPTQIRIRNQKNGIKKLKSLIDATRISAKELELDLKVLQQFRQSNLESDSELNVNITTEELSSIKNSNLVLEQQVSALIHCELSLPRSEHESSTEVSNDHSSSQWACLWCTALNHLDMPHCELCRLPRIVPRPVVDLCLPSCSSAHQSNCTTIATNESDDITVNSAENDWVLIEKL